MYECNHCNSSKNSNKRNDITYYLGYCQYCAVELKKKVYTNKVTRLENELYAKECLLSGIQREKTDNWEPMTVEDMSERVWDYLKRIEKSSCQN